MKLVILFLTLLLIQGNDALFSRFRKSFKKQPNEEKEFLFEKLLPDAEPKAHRASIIAKSSLPKDDLPEYKDTLANVCVYEGITAARVFLENAPMSLVMRNRTLIGDTLEALMQMKNAELFNIRKKYCVNWILTHFVVSEKPTKDIVHDSLVNEQIYDLTFAQGFYEGHEIIGTSKEVFLPDILWPRWATTKLTDHYQLKNTKMGPWMYNFVDWFYQNKYWNLFWDLDEESYNMVASLPRHIFEDNVAFSIFNGKETFLVAIIQKLKETGSEMYAPILIESLKVTTLTGDCELTRALLPQLTPEQAYFYGFPVNGETKSFIQSKLTHDNDNEANAAVKYFKSLVGFALAGRKFEFILEFTMNLPVKMLPDFVKFLNNFSNHSNLEFMEVLDRFKKKRNK